MRGVRVEIGGENGCEWEGVRMGESGNEGE